MKTENKIILIIIFLVALSIIGIESTKAQSTHLKWYRNLQTSVEYPERMKANQTFSKKNAKANLKQAKKDIKEDRKEEKDREDILAIREKIESLKAKEND